MDVKKIIKDAIKQNRIIIGYNRVIKEIKTKKPKIIVYANKISNKIR